MDESTPTCGKRLFGIGVENTYWRIVGIQRMYGIHSGIGAFISGAILFEETLFQDHADGESMVEKLNKAGIIPGIKVDKGLKQLAGGLEHETYCSGLDGLTALVLTVTMHKVQGLLSGEQYYKSLMMVLLK